MKKFSKRSKLLKKVKGRKTSSGADNVSWKEVSNLDPERLLELYNYCLDNRVTPTEWNIVHIIPLFSKPSTKPSDPATYRGITLESCLIKLYTTLYAYRVLEWATNSDLLPKEQQGFRKDHRTENSTFILYAILQCAPNEKQDICIAFVDLEKAFDSVCRELLWKKMRAWGATGKLFDGLRLLYGGIHSIVKFDGTLSEIFKNDLGVLQGDPLSGLLWIIFICDILLEGTRGKCFSPKLCNSIIRNIMMADDIAIHANTKEESNVLLAEVSQYCNDNLLNVSTKKSVVMEARFSAKSKRTEVPIIYSSNGSPLTETQSAKYIGVIFELKETFNMPNI